MNRFEHSCHTARRDEGELSVEQFGDLWYESQHQMLGDSVEITDGYRTWWSYIPHFIATPGYVYAYAYGQLLALSVYARFEIEGDAFVPAYLDLLRAGGSKSPEELGAIVGCDLADPDFWATRPAHRGAPTGVGRASRSSRRPDHLTGRSGDRIPRTFRPCLPRSRHIRRHGTSLPVGRTVRRPHRRPGAAGRRADRRRGNGPALAACLLHPPWRPHRTDASRGRSNSQWQELLHPPCRCPPSRPARFSISRRHSRSPMDRRQTYVAEPAGRSSDRPTSQTTRWTDWFERRAVAPRCSPRRPVRRRPDAGLDASDRGSRRGRPAPSLRARVHERRLSG